MTTLTSLATVDALLMELTMIGAIKAPTVEPTRQSNGSLLFRDVSPERTFWRTSTESDLHNDGMRYINIYPELKESTGQMFAQIHHDEDGRLLHDRWYLCEHYAGHGIELDPSTTTLAALGGMLEAWQESWERR